MNKSILYVDSKEVTLVSKDKCEGEAHNSVDMLNMWESNICKYKQKGFSKYKDSSILVKPMKG